MAYVYRYIVANDPVFRYETRKIEEGPPVDNQIVADSICIVEVIDKDVVASTEFIDNIAGDTILLTGSAAHSVGLTFNVTALSYRINGLYYTSSPQTITLNPADTTNSRVDILFVDETGVVNKLTGVASVTPIPPILSTNQVLITEITVPANSLTPNITNTLIYNELAVGEWSWTSTVNITINSTNNPFDGITCIEATTTNNDNVTGSGTYDVSNVNYFTFRLSSKALWTPGNGLIIYFKYNNQIVSQLININDGFLGFDSTITNYQHIIINNTTLGFSSSVVDTIVIEANGVGFYLDYIQFQEGLAIPSGDQHSTRTDNPHQVTKTQVGLSELQNIKSNYNGTTIPTSTNDNTQGYSIGSRWIYGVKEYVCINSNTNSAQWIDTTVATATGTSTYFDAYNSTQQLISSTYTDLLLEVQRIMSSSFSHTVNTSTVTVLDAGTYLVIARVTTNVTAGTSRSESQAKIVIDTGAGFTDVTGSIGMMYNRKTLEGGNTASIPCILQLNAGDKLKVQARVISGTNTVVYEANACSLSIIRTIGEKGADGAQGPPGAGSTVVVEEAGVNKGTFTNLNFIGNGATVTAVPNVNTCDITVTVPSSLVYGSEFQLWESPSTTSTTSSTFINKPGFPVTTTSLPIGKYRIGYCYGWNGNANTSDFEANILFDNLLKMEHNKEPKDSAGPDRPTTGTGTNQLYRVGGFFYIDTTTISTHTINLRIKSSSAGTIVSIFDVRIELWRVA